MSLSKLANRKLTFSGAWVAAAVFATALGAVYWPFLREPGSLYARVVRDYWGLYNSYPEFDLSFSLLYRYGRFPLWNFLSGFGQPLLADLQSAPFHPARLIFFLGFWKVVDVWLLVRVFISGMLSYSLLRRSGVGVGAATFGGLAWMFTGSVTDYMNMHYLDVDLMLPAAAIVFGLMAERGRKVDVVGAALIVCLAFLAGNPTSALYLLMFISFYYFFLVYRSREDVAGAWMRFVSAAALAGLFAAIVLLPFREYLAFAWDYHPDGVGGITIPPRRLLSLFGPEIYGPPDKNGVPLVQRIPYMGTLPIVVAFFGALTLRRISSKAAFFLAASVVLIGLVVGALPFAFFAHLPLLIRTSNFRYAAPEAAFSVAMLGAFALDHMSRWRESSWKIVMMPIMLSIVGAWIVSAKLVEAPIEPVFGRGVAFVIAIAWIVSAILFLYNSERIGAKMAVFILIALWTVEAGVHVHFTPQIAPNDPKIYSQLPMGVVERPLLEGRNYAKPPLLYPNLNLVGRMMDVRYLGALYPKRYVSFMTMLNDWSDEELLGEFLPYNFIFIEEDKLESNLLDLMGVTTIVSDVAMPKNTMISKIFETGDVQSPGADYVIASASTIRGDKRVSIRQHPPSRISFDAPIGFVFVGIGIDDSKWMKGDGVFFNAYRETESGRRLVFSRHIDPANIDADRRWLDFVIPHQGGRMVLETQPGGDYESDWAAWGDLRTSGEEPTRYNLIKDTPLKIYENTRSMLGAFVVKDVDVVDNAADAARRLTHGYDFNHSALVEGAGAYELRIGNGPQDDYEIGIDRYFGDKVKLTVRLKNPGVVVLNDAYFPGWKAYIDGVETKIYPADVAFRAVKGPVGGHFIEFVYKPIAFRIGLWLTLSTIALFVLTLRFGVDQAYAKEDSPDENTEAA